MLPTGSDIVSGNRAEKARLYISARGGWSKHERGFFDVRVTHPTAASHQKKSLDVCIERMRWRRRELIGIVF